MELYDKDGGINETVFGFLKKHFGECDFTSHDVFTKMRKEGHRLSEDQVRRSLYNMHHLKDSALLKLRRAQYRLRKPTTYPAEW